MMLGAIASDMIGAPFETAPIKSTNFPLFAHRSRFTDDTVLTVAVAHAILEQQDYGTALKTIGRRYPRAGYGGTFFNWLHSDNLGPYNSWGNGSAMRVSPVGLAFETVEAVLAEAARSAVVTHNHPEGVKGAQSVALAVHMAKIGHDKTLIQKEISRRFGYDLTRTLADLRPGYTFDVSCQGSVPEAIIAFLESESFEDAVRLAVSLGGDADTMACIAGAIAQAYYKEIPAAIEIEVRRRLPADLAAVLDRFCECFPF